MELHLWGDGTPILEFFLSLSKDAELATDFAPVKTGSTKRSPG
jgi:hypothetical protein